MVGGLRRRSSGIVGVVAGGESAARAEAEQQEQQRTARAGWARNAARRDSSRLLLEQPDRSLTHCLHWRAIQRPLPCSCAVRDPNEACERLRGQRLRLGEPGVEGGGELLGAAGSGAGQH